MTTLREAAQAALNFLDLLGSGYWGDRQKIMGDLRAALAAETAQPVAWMPISVQWPFADLDILFSDGSVVMSVIPQSDGDFWWRGGGAGERFFDPVYSEVTHWRLHDDSPLYTSPQPPADVPLTEREIELIDGMIEVQLNHAQRCDNVLNRPMADKQKGWDMERVELLRRIKQHGIV